LFRRVELLHVPERLSSNAQGHCFAQELVGGCHDSPRGIWRVRFRRRRVDPAAVKSEDGKYLDKRAARRSRSHPMGRSTGTPIPDYRRYPLRSHVCPRPRRYGLLLRTALKDSLKTMSYGDFLEWSPAVARMSARRKQNVMPASSAHPNDHRLPMQESFACWARSLSSCFAGRTRPTAS